MKSFAKEVQDKLQYYVYALVDPRDSLPFYIGKGIGDRTFQHDVEAESSDVETAKLNKIREITEAGFEVTHQIVRWGLDESAAFEVEASLIDYVGYMLGQYGSTLTNAVSGHHGERGLEEASILNAKLGAEPFTDSVENPKYILIKITAKSLAKHNGDIYETVRRSWCIGKDRVKKYPYVIAVLDQFVVGVFKVDYWEEDNERQSKTSRLMFTGTKAEEDVANIWLHKRVPSYYTVKGLANPCVYCRY